MRQQTQLQTVPRKNSKRKSRKTGVTIGIDLGDQWSHYCVLDEAGEIVEEGRFRTTPEALLKHFDGLAKARIAMEAGTHSIWINEQLQQFRRAMAQLPYEQREVIMLHFQAGMTFRTIGKSFGISANTAKSRYRYGLDKLRQVFKNEAKNMITLLITTLVKQPG